LAVLLDAEHALELPPCVGDEGRARLGGGHGEAFVVLIERGFAVDAINSKQMD